MIMTMMIACIEMVAVGVCGVCPAHDSLFPYIPVFFRLFYLSNLLKYAVSFKIVADYFVQMRKNKNYVASEVTIKHVHELLQLMAVMFVAFLASSVRSLLNR